MTTETADIPSNITVPPEEIRHSIDKTVTYVLKNGPSFEERLKANNTNHKFDFIETNNEYHPYYKWKLDGTNTMKPGINTTSSAPVQSNGTSAEEETSSSTTQKPRELKFLVDLPQISSLDVEIIKLTALQVARNGDDYAKKLQEHEKSIGNRAQFDFMNESHSFNKLYKTYIDQYKLLLKFYDNSKQEDEEVIELMKQLNNSGDMLKNAFNRAQYNRENKVKRKEQQKQREQKQLHFASIDWQDFTIVGMIEFDAVDEVKELPEPLSRDDLIYRSLEAKSKDIVLPEKTPQKQEGQTKNEADKKTQNETPKETSPAPLPVIKGMKIRAAGESRLKRATTTSSEATIKCPITGKMIPESKFDNHLKVLLRDPRYKQEQENFVRKNFSYASNLSTDQVYENIKRLVRKRDGESVDEPEKKRLQIGPK
ncbi:pre-mRNA splicing factor [Scheffersomyces xylosifermentans]|uniref:pre-mRNA splicing factor n=1 Tax=Scheffersomyces xylosifermentans TaxID=1304137 RepID=UPI00315D5509